MSDYIEREIERTAHAQTLSALTIALSGVENPTLEQIQRVVIAAYRLGEFNSTIAPLEVSVEVAK